VDKQGLVYVADRENHRIQVFDSDGRFLKLWNNVGAPWSICITPGPKQVIWSADGFTGRFYKLDLDGHILGEFGKAGKLAGQFGWTHGIACPSENLIYAAEELNFRVQKLTVESQ
jgi:DNA-binding beta-propeller fold protein YncE